MRRQILFVWSLCVASSAPAAEWVSFATCGGPSELRYYSYDSASIARQGPDVLVQVRGDYSRVRGARATEGQIVWALNCDDRTFIERSRTELLPDRSVFANYDSPTSAMRIAPNSVPDKLLRKVCARVSPG